MELCRHCNACGGGLDSSCVYSTDIISNGTLVSSSIPSYATHLETEGTMEHHDIAGVPRASQSWDSARKRPRVSNPIFMLFQANSCWALVISVKPVTLLLQRFLSKLFTIFSVNDVEQICGSKFQHISSLAWNTSTAQWGAAWDWSIDSSRIILMNHPDMSSRDRWIKAPTMPWMSCSKASHPSHQQRNRMLVQRFIGATTFNLPRRVAMEQQGRVSLNKWRRYPSI